MLPDRCTCHFVPESFHETSGTAEVYECSFCRRERERAKWSDSNQLYSRDGSSVATFPEPKRPANRKERRAEAAKRRRRR